LSEESSCTNFSNPVYETYHGEEPGCYIGPEIMSASVLPTSEQSDMKGVAEITAEPAQYSCMNDVKG